MQKWVFLTAVFLSIPLYTYATREGIRGFNNTLSAKNNGTGRLSIALDFQGSLDGKRNQNLWATSDVGLGLGYVCNDWLTLNIFTRYMFDMLDSTAEQNYLSHGFSDLQIGAKLTPPFLRNQNGGLAFSLMPVISLPMGAEPEEDYPGEFLGSFVGRGGIFRYFTSGRTNYGGRLLFSYTRRRNFPLEVNLNLGYLTHNKDRDGDLISYGVGMGFIFRNIVPYIEVSGKERVDKDKGPRLLYLTSGVKIGNSAGSHMNLAFNYNIDGLEEGVEEYFPSSYISIGERATPSWSLNISYVTGFSFSKPPKQRSLIAGKIIDSETGEPLVATMTLPDTNVTTDSTGEYSIQTAEGSYTIKATKDGYLTQEKHLELEAEREATISFELEKAESNRAHFSGEVMDRITKDPVVAEISFPETEIESQSTDENGKFELSLQPNTYIVRVHADGYIPCSVPILLKEENTLCRDIYLLKDYEKIRFHGINFEEGSAEIDPEYYPILSEGLNLLMEYPNIKVEIRGYTDNLGSEDVNWALSEKRAESVMNYFIEMGIDPSRLRAVGCGEEEPLASNDMEQGRALNRRIEFWVIGIE